MPNNFPQQTLYLVSGSPQTENRAATVYPGQLGQRAILVDKSDSNRAKGWQVVQLDSTMSVLPYAGAVAWWKDRAKYLVTTSASAPGRGQVAGVFQSTAATAPVTADVTAQNIVCIQVKGIGNVNYIDSPTASPDATGLFVTPSATDAKADCLAAGTASSYPKIGMSAGAATSHFGLVDIDVDENP
jgi:hypothetical protein